MVAAFVLDFPLLFLSPEQAATIDALVGQIIPSEEGSPGAREAGVTEYIDRGLAGFFRDLRPLYRNGLLALAELTAELTSSSFTQLDEESRRGVVARLDATRREQPGELVGTFFAVVREHTIQGYFGDPAHGGNRGLVGWRLVGFPGAQWGYSPEQMAPGFDTTSIPLLTVKDLYVRIGGAR